MAKRSTTPIRIVADSPCYSCDITVPEWRATASIKRILRCYRSLVVRHGPTVFVFGSGHIVTNPDWKLNIDIQKLTA